MRSDWRSNVVDLTGDTDSDKEDIDFAFPSQRPSQIFVPPPAIPASSNSNGARPSSRGSASHTLQHAGEHTANSVANPSSSYKAFNSTTAGRNGAASQNYASALPSTPSGANNTHAPALDQSAKRRKLAVHSGQVPHIQSLGDYVAAGSSQWTTPRSQAAVADRTPTTTSKAKLRTTDRIISVNEMKAALKTNKGSILLPQDLLASAPRPLTIGHLPQGVNVAPSWPTSSSLPPPETVQTTPHRSSLPSRSRTPSRPLTQDVMEVDTSLPIIEDDVGAQGTIEEVVSDRLQEPVGHRTEDGTHADLPVVLQAAPATFSVMRKQAENPGMIVSTRVSSNSTKTRGTGQFSEEDDHFLIFLKEIKKYTWRDITTEFAKYRPGRPYPTLQTRYSSVLNKRNRSDDPTTLNLPPDFSAEATIDRSAIRAGDPVLRRLSRPSSPRDKARGRHVHESFAEQGYSSGADSGSRRERSRRAPAIDYNWDRLRAQAADSPEQEEENGLVRSRSHRPDDAMQLDSPAEKTLAVHVKTSIPNDPLKMQFGTDDSRIGLIANRTSSEDSKEKLPYLNFSQRRVIQNPLSKLGWDLSASREWKGTVLHVDFSPVEIGLVNGITMKLFPSGCGRSRHSKNRRNLKHTLNNLTEAKRLQLVHQLSRRLSSRNADSIRAFLDDARTGNISRHPQVQRLATVKPKSIASVHGGSTISTIRQRELGLQSRRGWKTTSSPLSYQTRNMMMDTLGPTWSWTGASSDIHTVSWSPNGECFAAGAVAVTDQDSMQYNRPNNLLYGNISDGVIHELGEHNIARPKTESGANSTGAMFESQDPRLYTTVSAVAFSPYGNLMYSAGYDQNVCVWNTTTDSSQPTMAHALLHKAEVDMMTVSQARLGTLATAAKRNSDGAVKLITFDEDSINDENFRPCANSYNSKKAVDKPELNILPTALQFEPLHGRLLLAGFGANVRQDNGLDTTGDICVWDLETRTQLNVHGSSRNVFDVTFNPNQRHMPLFAVGCVANGNVNRGIRSVLRLYAGLHEPIRYTSQVELECEALDMNDVVWCPYEESLIAAGCTNGRVYVWDLRWHDRPLRVLSHGRSLMPLQEDVPHEVTDTGIRFLSWGDNSTRLYSGSSDGVVKVWDVTRSQEDTHVKDLVHTDSGIMSGAFSPDFSKVVLGEVNGSVNVLEVGGSDKATEELRYFPWNHEQKEEDKEAVLDMTASSAPSGSAAELTDYLLETGQLQLVPMGGLPIRQAVQGPNYEGPYDRNVDAPYLRQQALEFQLELAAMPAPSCDIADCKSSINKVTSEEAGDSGRSSDRIPDELRKQWKAPTTNTGILPGKSKCTECNRPARPSISQQTVHILCERCSFACLRCGATNPIAPETTTLVCDFCAGVWDMGALGFECVQQPAAKPSLDVPLLKRFGKESYAEFLEDAHDTAFGDEMNALSDYYFSLAIDRPESPPL